MGISKKIVAKKRENIVETACSDLKMVQNCKINSFLRVGVGWGGGGGGVGVGDDYDDFDAV